MLSSPLRLAAGLLAAALPLLALLLPRDTATRVADEKKPAARLTLKKGDRIGIIGNTLAERMQHDGWLEAYLHSRFPNHDLTFRHLGFSGDELTLRLRSASFGSPDDWLTRAQAAVVFAFFGYNESFKDKAGLDGFKKDLADFIKKMLAKKYNGKSAPRLVLFSPIAHEDLKDANLPDGKDNNRRLKLYTAAMAEVAQKHNVPFVDLHAPTLALYGKGKGPFTINGVHLTEKGNEELAKIIDGALFPAELDQPRTQRSLAKLREAILDKNFHWFHRYRTVDGYSIYGGRADLVFKPDDQTNRVVMQREMEVLDVMTANRDKRVWAAAKGKELKVDDSNTPDFLEVKTNKPGDLPGGKHAFLSGEKAIEKMKVAKGFKVQLFASEKDFPELVNPVQMTFDAKGRLWVAVWPTYPHWKPKEKMNDKILVLEDTDADGKADKCTVFADGLHCPTGFELYNGGVLVAQAPDLWFLKDTKGTGKADLRRRVLGGLDSADTHHASNSFVLDPGGALYFQEGTFHHSQVETPYGPPVRLANAGVFRYEPRSQKFDTYVTYGFANPHGHVFDRWGQDIVVDGTSSTPYHAALFSGKLEFPAKHPKPPQVWAPPTRPCPGMEYVSSRHFPASWQGDLLVGNVIGLQGILRFKVSDDGASFVGHKQEDFLSSSDPNFRPSDLKIGPDGALYFIDWHNPIIGHMQHNLRDPSRDRDHGRVYKVVHEQNKLLTPAKIAGEPIDKLLELLKEPEDRTRYRARIELAARKTDDVLKAAKKWVEGLDTKSANHEHELLEALWLHQSHNVVNAALLEKLLTTKDFRARAAATRVLCYWRDRVGNALELLKKQAADAHPRVRLEAVRAASFFTEPEALEVVLIAADKPMDRYLDYTRGETMKALQPYVKKAIAEGRKIKFTTPTGARYFLRTVTTDDLLKMERTQAVCMELLFRKGVRDEHRGEALNALAKLEKKAALTVLLGAIRSHDEQKEQDDESLAFDLARLLTGRGEKELAGARDELVKLATTADRPVTRQLGFVALAAADGGTDKAWALAVKSTKALHDFVAAVPMIRDPGQRADAYPRVAALLDGLPKELAEQTGKKGLMGRYVRIELPGRQRTLTLAEVEVYSEGVNVARKGKASQKNTAHGGVASRAIDGKTSGTFADGGQTHSVEGTRDPWWQVDLVKEVPIDSIVVYNRADGELGSRLSNFTVKVLDERRGLAWSKARNPAPELKATFTLGTGSPEKVARALAMQALPTMRGKEAEAVPALVKFLKDDGDRQAAVVALGRIPTQQWPKEQAEPVMKAILAFVRKVPVKERTATPVLDAMQLADSVAGLLPPADAKKARKELGELGVRVIRLGTLVEQMLYDKERIVVQAGKPFEVLFENTDTMPHNFALIEPGSLEEIGELAEKTVTEAKAAQRHYIPVSKKVLLSSKLLQPRQSERLSFKAPTKPGVYPYVCTYPGHWRRMHGALYVVADLEAYQAGPEEYLKKHPLKIADALLKSNRPRTEWKYEELEPLVKDLKGRSFANGKQMFTVGTCTSCHKFGGAGQEFGPDLTKLDPKWTVADVLKHTLDPSLKIDDKYRNWTFTMDSGKIVTGMILKETKEQVEVVENPLVATKATVLKVKAIESRAKSASSPMPKGLLDKLTREEVLDLMAYVFSGANPKHKAFQGEHKHDHHGH